MHRPSNRSRRSRRRRDSTSAIVCYGRCIPRIPARRNCAGFGFAMLALTAIFPWLGGPFYTRLAIESFLFGAIALSVDILLGYAGLLSLGQAAYFGLAAYISALMYLHVTQSFWLVLVAVIAAVAVFSLVLGAVAIRAKGVYFALITFGAAEILSKI